MPRETVARRFEVPVPPAAVHALLADPRRLPEIHPLIDAVVVTRDEDHDGERRIDFDVTEHVPLLGLSVPNRYRGEARWRVGAVDTFTVAGISAPRVTVRTDYVLAPTETGTRVEQTTTVEAPWWISAFVFRTARTAHDGAVARVRERLGG